MPITSTRDDQRVQPGIGHEGDQDLLVQHDHDEAAQDQEHHHPDQEDPGRGQFERVEISRHGGVRVASVSARAIARKDGTDAAITQCGHDGSKIRSDRPVSSILSLIAPKPKAPA